MYPIPRYITDYFILDKEKSHSHNIDGVIQCTCGCQNIRIRYFGEEFTDDKNDRCISVGEYQNDFAFAVYGNCTQCNSQFVIFDIAQYGFDGYICQNNLPAPSDELQTYLCECGSDKFIMNIGFEPENYQQFIEEAVENAPDKFKPQDYVDAFNWITIDIQCCQCGKIIDNWVNLELS